MFELGNPVVRDIYLLQKYELKGCSKNRQADWISFWNSNNPISVGKVLRRS